MTQQQYEDLTLPDHLAADERDIEAPDNDAFEQARAANPADEPDEPRLGLEVSDWDAAEQAQIVDLDDDYDR
ncbi:MAG TPA: hypothetical protein VFY17_03885 [Pilimelia sp.]|nr:hypothetical protein [Pilimelia sp.]